jgi:hypothetical protein
MKALVSVIFNVKSVITTLLVFFAIAGLLAYGELLFTTVVAWLTKENFFSIAPQALTALMAAVMLRIHVGIYQESELLLANRDADAYDKRSSLLYVAQISVLNNIGTAGFCWAVMVYQNEEVFSRALGTVCIAFLLLATLQGLCVMLKPQGLLKASRRPEQPA